MTTLDPGIVGGGQRLVVPGHTFRPSPPYSSGVGSCPGRILGTDRGPVVQGRGKNTCPTVDRGCGRFIPAPSTSPPGSTPSSFGSE